MLPATLRKKLLCVFLEHLSFVHLIIQEKQRNSNVDQQVIYIEI